MRLFRNSPLPKGWGFPSPVFVSSLLGPRKLTGGMVWHGRQPATEDDIEALKAARPYASVDELSLVGKDSVDPKWTTFYQENKHLMQQKVKLG